MRRRASAPRPGASSDGPPRDVAAVIASWPEAVRTRALELRTLILRSAARTSAVGPLTETLKWGEPAWLTETTRSGSTLRLGWKAPAPTRCALYFNCRTDLVDRFRTRLPDLTFERNRAITLDVHDPLPQDAIEACIHETLTYHLLRRRGQRA